MPSSIAVECLTKPDLGLMLLKQIIEIIRYPVVESAKFHNKEGKKKKFYVALLMVWKSSVVFE